MESKLENFPTELFLNIFDYFWAHELFYSFGNLNQHLNQILSHAQLHISSENQNLIFSPDHIISLLLTSAPVSLDHFINLRSLTLIKCNLDSLLNFPPSLSRLCIQNTKLSDFNLKLILENPTLINVQLNLHNKIIFSPSILTIDKTFSNIEYLTINYISLNDIIQLIDYTKKLKYLHISLFGMNREKITNFSPISTVNRLVCLSMGISFDILCSQFLSRYFPNIENLSIFTSFVEKNLFVSSLEQLLVNNLLLVRKLNVSAQFIINHSLVNPNNNENLQTIAKHFRTAFWIKRNCRATFKVCHDDPHTIRLYLQSNKTRRTRPSRFVYSNF